MFGFILLHDEEEDDGGLDETVPWFEDLEATKTLAPVYADIFRLVIVESAFHMFIDDPRIDSVDVEAPITFTAPGIVRDKDQ